MFEGNWILQRIEFGWFIEFIIDPSFIDTPRSVDFFRAQSIIHRNHPFVGWVRLAKSSPLKSDQNNIQYLKQILKIKFLFVSLKFHYRRKNINSKAIRFISQNLPKKKNQITLVRNPHGLHLAMMSTRRNMKGIEKSPIFSFRSGIHFISRFCIAFAKGKGSESCIGVWRAFHLLSITHYFVHNL